MIALGGVHRPGCRHDLDASGVLRDSSLHKCEFLGGTTTGAKGRGCNIAVLGVDFSAQSVTDVTDAVRLIGVRELEPLQPADGEREGGYSNHGSE